MEQQQILHQEMEFRRTLRDQPRVKAKKIIEYDEEQEEKLIQSKSKRWWVRVNRKYFPVLTEGDILQHKHNLYEKQLKIPEEVSKPKVPSFFTANIFSKEPRLFDRKGIKVLFKKQSQANQNILIPKYCAINYFFNLSQEEILKKFKTQISIQNLLPMQQKTLSVKCLNLLSNQPVKDKYIESEQLMELGLSLHKATNDINFITDVLKYQVDRLLPNGQNEMQNEIMLWEKQVQKISEQNEQIWSKMFKKFKLIQAEEDQDFISNQIRQGSDLQQMMNQMFKFLSWKDVLLNFKKGYSDKTQDMLAEALQIMYIKCNMKHQKKLRKHNEKVFMEQQQLNKFLETETDCKICFSTYSSQKNRVVYCEICKDSFHEGCYGIQELDKIQEFICDSCQYISLCGNNKTIHKLKTTCSICSVPFFPTKNINGNFYHPACLFLNNFIQHKSGTIQLRDKFQHNKILEIISNNQIQMSSCQFCMQTANRGLRVQCSFQGCTKCYHHLCAYLNAGFFDIWRRDKSLEVKVSCHQHYENRDFYRQAYLRRFFCNFNNISRLSQQQFILIYDEQLMQIKQFKMSSDPLSLIKMSKIIQEYKESHLRKKMKQKSQKKKHKHKQHKEKHRHHSKQGKSVSQQIQNNHFADNIKISEGQSIQRSSENNVKLIKNNEQKQFYKDRDFQEEVKNNTKFIIKKKSKKSQQPQLYEARSKISFSSNLSQTGKILRSSKLDLLKSKQKQRQQAMNLYFEQANNFGSNLESKVNMFSYYISCQEEIKTTQQLNHHIQYQSKQKSSDYSIIDLQTIQSQCQKKMISCQNCSL